MLLETLDIRKNDILIYSNNKFDFENNFKIIFKRDKIKRPKKISYFDVCEYVKDTIPKNLIVYRLLTNVKGLDAYSTKYGYFLKIDNRIELIYFDPIFAFKDLRHLRFDLEPEKFRFKIQQIGLTTSSHIEGEAIYSEAYSFDLRAEEAQNQNDKIFADAIFIFDENYIDEEIIENVEAPSKNQIIIEGLDEESSMNIENISNDEQKIKSEIEKVIIDHEDDVSSVRRGKIDLLKKALGLKEEEFKTDSKILSNFHSRQESLREDKQGDRHAPSKESEGNDINVFDLFKTASKFDYLNRRKKESFILKINMDK